MAPAKGAKQRCSKRRWLEETLGHAGADRLHRGVVAVQHTRAVSRRQKGRSVVTSKDRNLVASSQLPAEQPGSGVNPAAAEHCESCILANRVCRGTGSEPSNRSPVLLHGRRSGR